MKRLGVMLLLAAASVAPSAVLAVDVASLVKRDQVGNIKLSPNGDYYAAEVQLEDRTTLAIIRRGDGKVTANFSLGENTAVAAFEWVNPERVIISVAEKFGALDKPQFTGELYAMNVNGAPENLAGFRVRTKSTGTRLKTKDNEPVLATLVDDLPADDKFVIVSTEPFGENTFTRAERMDVYSGVRAKLASVPVRGARYLADNKGVVRLAKGANSDNVSELYFRKDASSEWQLINNQRVSGRIETPIGFSEDNNTAYLITTHREGPDSIVAFDTGTQTRKEVLRDKVADPDEIIYRNGTVVPVGAVFADGKPRTVFFDSTVPEARLQRSLEAAFGGDSVFITSQTSDGKLVLVETDSDRNAGDFYIFDTVNKKAHYLASRRNWLDPAKMAPARPIQLTARDGLVLHGYVTSPAGMEGKKLPMIVLPHGGPIWVRDDWSFDEETQVLASAGYAVLRVNFRGSLGFGRAFEEAGAYQWGKAMQDDLTDATLWAITQGIADPQRICIYGGSYGAYASLMGVVREPDLYKCAVGYVGVYNLPAMYTDGEGTTSMSERTYLADWVGKPEALAEVSPTRLANRIKAPVFLAAGGEDEIAPIKHSETMEKALRAAGVPVETLYYPTEGHGFYTDEHKIEYYTRLLGFLNKHIGGKLATTSAPSAGAAK